MDNEAHKKVSKNLLFLWNLVKTYYIVISALMTTTAFQLQRSQI